MNFKYSHDRASMHSHVGNIHTSEVFADLSDVSVA